MLPSRIALAVAACCVAVPAGVAEAAPRVPVSFSAGPVAVKGYQLNIYATKAPTGAKPVALSVQFVRRAGTATQTHAYSFELPARALTVARSGASARLKAALGRYGSIDLVVAGGRARTSRPPRGCTGPSQLVRSGAVTGRLRFVADTTYFRTIRTVPRKGLLSRSTRPGTLDCSTGTPPTTRCGVKAGTLVLSGMSGTAGTLSVQGSGANVTQTVLVSDAPATTAPARVLHLITARGGSLTATADLAGGRLVAPAGPFLRGALDLAASGPASEVPTGCGERSMSTAVVTPTGDYTARFDSIGERTLFAAGQEDAFASLTRY